ncbi:MAG: hypothetical protein AB1553_00430 [Nitrospirota bacterium]
MQIVVIIPDAHAEDLKNWHKGLAQFKRGLAESSKSEASRSILKAQADMSDSIAANIERMQLADGNIHITLQHLLEPHIKKHGKETVQSVVMDCIKQGWRM